MNPVEYCYSLNDIRRLMNDYEIIELRKEHVFPYVIGKYIKYQYEKIWYFRWIPRALFRWLERRFGWHTLVVARKNMSDPRGE